jgi:hypothetical protein
MEPTEESWSRVPNASWYTGPVRGDTPLWIAVPVFTVLFFGPKILQLIDLYL